MRWELHGMCSHGWAAVDVMCRWSSTSGYIFSVFFIINKRSCFISVNKYSINKTSSSSSSGFAPFPSSVAPGEPPPPYSPQGSPDSSSAPVISCRVCQTSISVEGKTHQHVVKCNICNEATVRGRYRELYSLDVPQLQKQTTFISYKLRL